MGDIRLLNVYAGFDDFVDESFRDVAGFASFVSALAADCGFGSSTENADPLGVFTYPYVLPDILRLLLR